MLSLKLWLIKHKKELNLGFFFGALFSSLIFKFVFWDFKMKFIEKENKKVISSFMRNENCKITFKSDHIEVIHKRQ